MDGTSLLILLGVIAIAAGVAWAARGWSGLDARGRMPQPIDPEAGRGERGGPGADG